MSNFKKDKDRSHTDKVEIEFDKESEEVMRKLMGNIYGGVISASWARIFNRNFKRVLNSVGNFDRFMIMGISEKDDHLIILSMKGANDVVLLFNKKYFNKFKKAFKEYMNLDMDELNIITENEKGEKNGDKNQKNSD